METRLEKVAQVELLQFGKVCRDIQGHSAVQAGAEGGREQAGAIVLYIHSGKQSNQN